MSAGAVLKQRKFLNLKSFKHPVKRSEIITAIVNNCRLRSGQFGSFGESFHKKLSRNPYFPRCPAEIGGSVPVGPFTMKVIYLKTKGNIPVEFQKLFSFREGPTGMFPPISDPRLI